MITFNKTNSLVQIYRMQLNWFGMSNILLEFFLEVFFNDVADGRGVMHTPLKTYIKNSQFLDCLSVLTIFNKNHNF